MPQFNGLLMRDSLADTGVVPSPGYFYKSPDIICHSQVADPKTFFKANYDQNPNQPLQKGSHFNRIYSRVKNLSASTISNQYVNVYWCQSSLFMTPRLWKPNRLCTEDCTHYVSVDPVPAGAIMVSNDQLLMDGKEVGHVCLVGIVSLDQDPGPSIPDDFNTSDQFVAWIRENQNICVHNLSKLQSFPNRQWERLDHIENPDSKPALYTIDVTVTGVLPDDTDIGVICEPMGINKHSKYKDLIGGHLFANGYCPAGFKGAVTTLGSLPSESAWPEGVKIDTALYHAKQSNDLIAKYAVDWNTFHIKPHQVEGLPENGVLVLLGSCSTEFTK
jgi:hypothetical protein